jgi:hypothetical protein
MAVFGNCGEAGTAAEAEAGAGLSLRHHTVASSQCHAIINHEAQAMWFETACTQDPGWRRISGLGQCSVSVLTMAI